MSEVREHDSVCTDNSDEFPYKVPGQYFYEGVLFNQDVRKSVLESRDSIECREDDVFIVTYPKSGTTWILEIANLLLHPEKLDGGSEAQERSVPFLEFHLTGGSVDHIENMKKMASPRLIKSHLAEHLFPTQAFTKKSKIIYVGRNPKDNAVSYYHFYKSVSGFGYYKGSWDAFLQMYLKDHIVWGGWSHHCLGWWKHNHESNVLYLKYEDVKKDERGTVEKIASFLGKEVDQQTLERIVTHCSFESMKKNPAVNREDAADVDSSVSPFMRKGIVGDWKNHFTVAQNEQIEQYYKERLGNTDLQFEW
ncbi:sulfotransferase 1B1-like [Ptychodera flava]|uniref:sulfotransferase 1B1-like n=1 Tax=Ptychodera flava TaxID=63121 RepID=UPI003969FF64